jgi:undecaprenyl-diphosphatase
MTKRSIQSIREHLALIIFPIFLFLEYYINFERDCLILPILIKDTFPEPIAYIDSLILRLINPTFVNPFLTPIFILITLFGGSIFLLAPVLYAYIKGYRKFSIYLLNTLVMTLGISYLMKMMIFRPRPFYSVIEVEALSCPSSPSFPSGHVMKIAGYMGVVYSQELEGFKKYLRNLTVLVAISRLYLGVHYPLDVFAGGIIGFILGYYIPKIVDYFISRWGFQI